MIEILQKNVGKWFKSLDILQRIKISEFYQENHGITDKIENGLTEQAEKWLIENYSDEIKDHVLLSPVTHVAPELLEACKWALNELANPETSSADTLAETIKKLTEAINKVEPNN